MTPPIQYMRRTRDYYAALGYGAPYEWAHFEDTPFAALNKPLRECSVAIVTTAAPFQPGKGAQGPGAPYNADAKFYQVYQDSTGVMPDLRISHIAIDRDHTSAEDIGTYFPLAALKRAAQSGKIGTVCDQFFGMPTNRSQKTTIETDCPELVSRVLKSGAEAVILVPNCPVCHQSVSLAARALEEAGVATVIMGCALDIVEHVGVPRFLFSDFPLGNSAGRPGDVESQDKTLDQALNLLVSAKGPNTTLRSPLSWPGNGDWKSDYSNPDKLTPAEIAERRAKFDAGKAAAKRVRDA